MAEEWAEAVLTGGDLSDCYDIGVEPTEEHALMLKDRTGTIRRDFVLHVEDGSGFSMAEAAG